MKHTPLPWSINEWPQRDADIRIGTIGTPLILTVNLRDVSINEHKANATFICHACNNYDKILGALKFIAEWHEHADENFQNILFEDVMKKVELTLKEISQ